MTSGRAQESRRLEVRLRKLFGQRSLRESPPLPRDTPYARRELAAPSRILHPQIVVQDSSGTGNISQGIDSNVLAEIL